jgi:L-alanine-DL-glutamate epimerase-like enolase superfamily enzyme
VSLHQDGCVGLGEAAGVFYLNDYPSSMMVQLEDARLAIEGGTNRHSLQRLLPAGGARNAVDCALWDLESKLNSCSPSQIAGLGPPKALLTTFTCGADTPQQMASTARGYLDAKAIKLKLTGEPVDDERVVAVREARPDVWLGVDANQALSRASLERLMPVFERQRVDLIEQPFPIGQEAMLDGLRSPIPIAADESAQVKSDLAGLVGRFDVVNIKLDKCGGLTEGLEMARLARSLGFETMVGNMLGTSLAMAPAYVLGQLCGVVDLDGPILLGSDREFHVKYTNGYFSYSNGIWGYPDSE